MDLLPILVRVLFAYAVAYALVRASGKRTLKQGDASSFVLALIIGDMFDDLFWAEVPAAQFIAGVSTLILLHLAATLAVYHAGARRWAAAAHKERR